jgi:hypothetical protein
VILHYLGKTSCVIAMKGANEYVRAARVQMERIEAAAVAWADLTNRSSMFHEHYVFGRGQLEHYDEWLDGHPKYEPLVAWDAGNLFGSTYTLAGRPWDVTRASLERLEQLVQEVEEAVMIADARNKFA